MKTFGFTDMILNNPNCKEYFESGIAGYIHHSQRTIETDEFLETMFRLNNWNFDYLATWLTSSNGRHFCDELFDLSLIDKLLKCGQHLKEIYNLGLIYSHPSHKGMANDTIRLRNELKDQLLK